MSARLPGLREGQPGAAPAARLLCLSPAFLRAGFWSVLSCLPHPCSHVGDSSAWRCLPPLVLLWGFVLGRDTSFPCPPLGAGRFPCASHRLSSRLGLPPVLWGRTVPVPGHSRAWVPGEQGSGPGTAWHSQGCVPS